MEGNVEIHLMLLHGRRPSYLLLYNNKFSITFVSSLCMEGNHFVCVEFFIKISYMRNDFFPYKDYTQERS